MRTLSADDFSAARDRLLIGRRDDSNALLPKRKTLSLSMRPATPLSGPLRTR